MLTLAAVVALHHLVLAVDPATYRAARSSPMVTRVVGRNTSIELVNASTQPKGSRPFSLVFTSDDELRFDDLPMPGWLSVTKRYESKPVVSGAMRRVAAITLELSADDARKLGVFVGKAGPIRGLEMHVRVVKKPRGITSIELATDGAPANEAKRLGRSILSCSTPAVCVWRFE